MVLVQLKPQGSDTGAWGLGTAAELTGPLNRGNRRHPCCQAFRGCSPVCVQRTLSQGLAPHKDIVGRLWECFPEPQRHRLLGRASPFWDLLNCVSTSPIYPRAELEQQGPGTKTGE